MDSIFALLVMFASFLTQGEKVKTGILSTKRKRYQANLILCLTIFLLFSFISSWLVNYRVSAEGIPLFDKITASFSQSASEQHVYEQKFSSLREFDTFKQDAMLETFQLKDWLSETHSAPTIRESSIKYPRAKWYTHDNTCVNNEDGSTRYWAEGFDRENYEKNVSAFSLEGTELPFRPSWLDMPSMNVNQTQVHHLRGKTLVSQCWRNSTPNPFHFLYAVGKLFSLFTSAKSQHFDHVVLHQCGNPLELGYFCEWMWKLVISFGVRRHFISQDTNFFATSKLPESSLFCMDRADVAYNKWDMGDPTALELKRLVNSEVTSKTNFNHVQEEPLTAENVTCKDCFSRLRFALYERPVGDASRRLITNKDEVFDLFREFSGKLHTVTVSKDTPIHEVSHKFNSFDILVTTHGSHMVNLIFTTRTRFSVIEVWGHEIFAPNDANRVWDNIVPFYKTSFPHGSTDADVEKVIQNFDKTDFGQMRIVLTSNIRVNIETLRPILQDAVENVCDCKNETSVQYIASTLVEN